MSREPPQIWFNRFKVQSGDLPVITFAHFGSDHKDQNQVAVRSGKDNVIELAKLILQLYGETYIHVKPGSVVNNLALVKTDEPST